MERQIRCFPYGDRSDVPRLQQVEQKAIGRQRNLGLCIYVTQPVSPVKQELFTISVHLSSYLILVGFISFGCVVLHTCQVTRFCRVTHGNRACHPHFPEHLSGHGFHYDDPESPRIGPYIRKNYLFGKYGDFTYRKDNNPESLNCFYNKNVKSFLQNVYWKEEVLIRACLFFTR